MSCVIEYLNATEMIKDLTAMKEVYDSITFDGMIEGIKKNIIPDLELVKHGQWLPLEHGCECSNCGTRYYFWETYQGEFADKNPYCSICGAKMDGGNDEN